ncbi:hypothetical protein Taro_029870 [Colocasia esculenta]|uniref:Uncharacterized protein n=1 Tax=Colocasia esculenta TaxID=4460 RepID=A0A843VW67_COLES|nr:hypothetical protein [Colocasia esculenta]
MVEDVELTTHIGVDESEEPICLSKGNEIEEVDPHEIKGSSGSHANIDVGQVSGEDSDVEEEYTSDECEDDDEDGDMVRGARSGSSSGWRMSSGRGFSTISSSGQFTPPPPTVAASYPSSVPPPLAVVYTSSSYSSRYSNHRFTGPSDEALSRSVWTTTARSNFKHLLYNARKNAQRVYQSPDLTLWRERAPTWMRRDYWEGLCNIWAAERWHETSTTMKVNRAANLEANKHTSGYVSFATHQSRLEKELKRPLTFQEVFDKTHKKKGTDQYISDRAGEVAESYSQ